MDAKRQLVCQFKCSEFRVTSHQAIPIASRLPILWRYKRK